MNMFEQVSSDGHCMPLAGAGAGSDVWEAGDGKGWGRRASHV